MYIQTRAALVLSAVFFWVLHVQSGDSRYMIQLEDGPEVTAEAKCDQMQMQAISDGLEAWCVGDVE